MSKFAVLRIRKISGMGNIYATEQHIKRTRETPNADPEQTPLNYNMMGRDNNLVDNLKEKLPEKVRKNAVLAVEHLMTASPEFFNEFDRETEDRLWQQHIWDWAYKSIKWAEEQYGKENILTAQVHLDESTPHIHLVTIPLVEGKLNARKIYNGRAKLVQLQDSYAEALEDMGLKRGLKGSKATHTQIKQFYKTLENPIEKPVKRGVADLGYQKRLETFIDDNAPLIGSNQVMIRERKNMQSTVEDHAEKFIREEMEAKYGDKISTLEYELGKSNQRHNILYGAVQERNDVLKEEVADLETQNATIQRALNKKTVDLEKSKDEYRQLKEESQKAINEANNRGALISQVCEYLYDKNKEKGEYSSPKEVYEHLVKESKAFAKEQKEAKKREKSGFRKSDRSKGGMDR